MFARESTVFGDQFVELVKNCVDILDEQGKLRFLGKAGFLDQ